MNLDNVSGVEIFGYQSRLLRRKKPSQGKIPSFGPGNKDVPGLGGEEELSGAEEVDLVIGFFSLESWDGSPSSEQNMLTAVLLLLI